MHNIKKVTDDIFYVGASDRRLALFENIYPISRGVSYNSYLVMDEKTVLMDTADSAVSRQFFENIKYVLFSWFLHLPFHLLNLVIPLLRWNPQCVKSYNNHHLTQGGHS